MQHQQMLEKRKWTIQKILNWATSCFKANDIESPRSTAEILLSYALKLKHIDLYLQQNKPLGKKELSFFKILVKRRTDREPVAYIIGEKGFWTLNLIITRDVLIPRPDTEHLVEETLSFLSTDNNIAPKRVLELGTGSGAVIIALASEKPENLFFASDYSTRAIMLAKKNAEHHKLEEKICFFAGQWFTPISAGINLFDIIVSNPPYIQTEVIPCLQSEIYKYEPVLALDGGRNGLCHISKIISQAHNFLNKNGWLLLEIGYDQQDAVHEIISNSDKYDDVSFISDYAGHTRVVRMKKKVTL